ncbi:MAG: dihydropteroate synthase [Actinomycetota bacterium]|nr:dihydropteroate synthase [Actinomycetota bacterium]
MGEKKKPNYSIRLMRVESREEARGILGELGCEGPGIQIMSSKMRHLVISVDGVQARAAHILKQVMLSKGGECATPRDVFFKSEEPVRVVLMGTISQFGKALKNLSVQPFGLSSLADDLKEVISKECLARPNRELKAGSFKLELGKRTLVMGVLNVTPDSFSDGGRYSDFSAARQRAIEMAEEGADIIDIGGESTRPGALPVSLEEECERLIPLIEALSSDVEVPISIDTCKAMVAERAVEAGACIVNDISALRFDPQMGSVVASLGVPLILMHMQGTPRNMQENPHYEDLMGEIGSFLSERAEAALKAGIDAGKVLIDPGIGFGKTALHNLEIIRRLEEFRSLPYPLVIGPSRKRFIGYVLDKPVDERLMGTAAAVSFAIARGADIVRVHDVKEMVDVVKVADAIAGKTIEEAKLAFDKS